MRNYNVRRAEGVSCLCRSFACSAVLLFGAVTALPLRHYRPMIIQSNRNSVSEEIYIYKDAHTFVVREERNLKQNENQKENHSGR